jgi:ribosome-associated translation inhibitor RaiA
MAIEIRGVPTDRALRTHVAARLASSVARLATKPTTAQVTFFDENGPKGGLAMRCAITLRLPYRPHVRVEDTAETLRIAFDGAFAKLERELERYQNRDREAKRHPKKYYTAKRLMATEAGEPSASPKPSSARSGLGRRRA